MGKIDYFFPNKKLSAYYHWVSGLSHLADFRCHCFLVAACSSEPRSSSLAGAKPCSSFRSRNLSFLGSARRSITVRPRPSELEFLISDYGLMCPSRLGIGVLPSGLSPSHHFADFGRHCFLVAARSPEPSLVRAS
ncbi:uncharacterized protein LOC120071951 [Benincasa hispida]|uniref:uncharacterized protein LOC120071951 n=1 Tax=Benincasa hispida TaxID=102211 RepID=UPI001900DE98|nr:uncharacterized protein LOC120071951 [Benincasa hispida]